MEEVLLNLESGKQNAAVFESLKIAEEAGAKIMEDSRVEDYEDLMSRLSEQNETAQEISKMFQDKAHENDESVLEDLEKLMQEENQKAMEKTSQDEQEIIDRLAALDIPDGPIQVNNPVPSSLDKKEEAKQPV